jgi:hypothetical protein
MTTNTYCVEAYAHFGQLCDLRFRITTFRVTIWIVVVQAIVVLLAMAGGITNQNCIACLATPLLGNSKL